jgi:hypothetical protein
MTALVWIAALLRAQLASHVALELVDGRRLSPADYVERDRLMSTAAEAFDLEIQVAGIERVPQRRGGLGRSLEGEHPFIPSLAGELIGLPAGLGCTLS